jgi:SET domain-containing protein
MKKYQTKYTTMSVQTELDIRSNKSVLYKSIQGKGLGLVAATSFKPKQLIFRNEVLVEANSNDDDLNDDSTISDSDSSSDEDDENKTTTASLNLDLDLELDSDCYDSDSEVESNQELEKQSRMAVNLIKRYPELMEYLHHSEEIPKLWRNAQIPQTLLRYKLNITQSEWIKALSIVALNAFSDDEWLKLHTLISLVNHSCAPNCKVYQNGLYATRQIHAGDELTINYDVNLEGVPFKIRQIRLLHQWNFICTCELCEMKE